VLSIVFVVVVSLAGVETASQDVPWHRDDAQRVKVVLHNPASVDIRDAPVVILRASMPFQNIYEDGITVVDPDAGEGGGEPIEFQLDDLDRDGVWDELFLMMPFRAGEHRTIYVYPNSPTGSISPLGAHATIASYGHHLVPWWESEFMGWKLWFTDSVDMYAKRSPRLVAHDETVMGISGHESPYEMGLDILEVRNTFGAGAICLFEEPENFEVVSRPRFSPRAGEGPILDTRCTYDLIANGPLRSIIRVNTFNWRTEKGVYELQQDFMAFARQSYSICSVRFTRFLPTNSATLFGVGMRKVMAESASIQNGGTVISIAQDMAYTDAGVTAPEYAGKRLAFMGIALVVAERFQPTYRLTQDYGGNHLFAIPVTEDHAYKFLIAGAWSEGTVNTSPNEFTTYVTQAAEGFNHPVVVTEVSVEEKRTP
jgi:hypothetical protein